MTTTEEYKKYIWRNLQRKEWSLDDLLSKSRNTADKHWNEAISAAQKWARYELAKKSKTPVTTRDKHKFTKQSNVNACGINRLNKKNNVGAKVKHVSLRKESNIDVEVLNAIKNIEERKKNIRRSNPLKNSGSFRSKNTFPKSSYKQYIDEGIGGTREDNKKMRGRQSARNKYDKY